MNNLLNNLIFAVVFIASTIPAAYANSSENLNSSESLNTMVLNYDGFFDRMDDLEDPEYSSIKLAFYLKDTKDNPCKVESVVLQTKHKSLEVYMLDDGELLLPFEPKYDQDKAAIVINKESNDECGLNMRLESTRLFSEEVSIDRSLSLINTFDTAFSDLGGMMSFMLPSVAGISFIVNEGSVLSTLDSSIGNCKQHICTLTKDELSSLKKPLLFNTSPRKAVPFIK